MSQGKNVPQSLYQPPISVAESLAALDGVTVGTGGNYTLYTAPARNKAILRWVSFTNRASSSTPTYVSFFVTKVSGASPRIFYHLFDVDDTLFLVSGGQELVLMPGDKLEAIATTRSVTADVYISGELQRLPS